MKPFCSQEPGRVSIYPNKGLSMLDKRVKGSRNAPLPRRSITGVFFPVLGSDENKLRRQGETRGRPRARSPPVSSWSDVPLAPAKVSCCLALAWRTRCPLPAGAAQLCSAAAPGAVAQRSLRSLGIFWKGSSVSVVSFLLSYGPGLSPESSFPLKFALCSVCFSCLLQERLALEGGRRVAFH